MREIDNREEWERKGKVKQREIEKVKKRDDEKRREK